jgi:hypothetical protein
MLKDLFHHIIENAVVFGEQGGRVFVQLEKKLVRWRRFRWMISCGVTETKAWSRGKEKHRILVETNPYGLFLHS